MTERPLSSSHRRILDDIREPTRRVYYTWKCYVDRWSVRELRRKKAQMLYESTALYRKPEVEIHQALAALFEKGEVSPALVFQDPYRLDFLDLPDGYCERDLQTAIAGNIDLFLHELGGGFTFVKQQKHLPFPECDAYLDLLLYHHPMRRFIAIELKVGEFKPADLGQINMYLGWLDDHARGDFDQESLGIILCTGKKPGTVECLGRRDNRIHIAEYLTRCD